MAKVKVEIIGCTIDGKGVGETVELEETQAKHYEAIKYVKIVEDEKKPTPKKAPAKRATTKKTEE